MLADLSTDSEGYLCDILQHLVCRDHEIPGIGNLRGRDLRKVVGTFCHSGRHIEMLLACVIRQYFTSLSSSLRITITVSR